ncbi:MAG: fused MFS/spermidine synthase [Sedimentisphaerales bacterium]|nr:fused MFS/spermidine synthase [Sedimentisphaerales bacterium]
MVEHKSSDAAPLQTPRRYLPLLLVLFVGSGCAALIYEIVWFQLLQLVIGSSAVSLGVLLGTYMGGMCLGSLALPRIISARRHPLRVYALLELGIGIIGIAVLFAIPHVGRLYTANVASGFTAILLRGLVCGICLLPPTILMGATLPGIARWLEATPQGVSWLGFFYGGNIVGAVFGCLLAGFYLLRVHDMATATFVAAAINGTVALIGLVLATRTTHAPASSAAQPRETVRAAGAWTVYVAIALSGMNALGAEVIWTRLLSLMLGATVYAFSIILAVFLTGLGIGSSVGAVLSGSVARPRLALAGCQVLLAGAIAWTAYVLTRSLPYWPIDPSLSTSPWVNFQLDLMRCTWAVLPAAILWGASFPLALASAASPGQDPGRLVGGVYAANTVGAIIGAIAFSMWVVPAVGTQTAQRVLVASSGVAALLVFALSFRTRRKGDMPARSSPSLAFRAVCAVLAIVSVGGVAALAWSVAKVPWGLIAYGRYLATYTDNSATALYVGEGMNASVAVTKLSDGTLNFHVSGKVEASSDPQDMRLQLMLGHISALFHPKPRSVLVVGCGAGVTAGTFVLHPSVERIVICEIEPLIPSVVARYFDEQNNDVLSDPRVEVVYDDARNYVLTTKEKFDVITSDPIHPWVKGAATLYTKEYFETCREHLNPGGVITQWVPLYESSVDVVRSEIATFFDVFPGGTIWSNDYEGQGYDVVLLGQTQPTKLDVAALEERLDRTDHLPVADSLAQVGFESITDLLATYAGQGADLAPWLEGAEINRDRNLRLQYMAGMGLNSYQEVHIYDEIMDYRAFPETLFVGSARSKLLLKEALGGARRQR